MIGLALMYAGIAFAGVGIIYASFMFIFWIIYKIFR